MFSENPVFGCNSEIKQPNPKMNKLRQGSVNLSAVQQRGLKKKILMAQKHCKGLQKENKMTFNFKGIGWAKTGISCYALEGHHSGDVP